MVSCAENNAVVIDTQIIAEAPVKLFASGMADAFAKYIETGLMMEYNDLFSTPVGSTIVAVNCLVFGVCALCGKRA